MQTDPQDSTQSAEETVKESLSDQAIALEKFKKNSRVKYVRIVVSNDCCPACRELEGAYEKDAAPALPEEACSHPLDCRCFYLPFLTEIYP